MECCLLKKKTYKGEVGGFMGTTGPPSCALDVTYKVTVYYHFKLPYAVLKGQPFALLTILKAGG